MKVKMLVIALMLASSGSAYGQQTATVQRDRVNVRAQPDINASIVSTVAQGAVVTVLEATETWTQIRVGAVTGWVRSSMLAGARQAAAEPATREAPVQPMQYTTSPQQRPAAGYKDPGTATLISVLCAGCGQIWAGETKRGVLLLLTGIGAPTIGAMITFGSCDSFGRGCSTAPFLLGTVAALGAWGFGIFDAGDSAMRMNAARGLGLGPAENVRFGVNEYGRVSVGMSIPVSFR